MASFAIHLAVGKRYYEKNKDKIKDKDIFYEGVLEPDFAEVKAISHYSGERKDDSIVEKFKKRTILYKFLKDNILDNDFNKGIFVHLITDFIFYNYFFDIDYVLNVSEEDFGNDIYYSYDTLNEFLNEKYNFDYNEKLKMKMEDKIFNKRDEIKEALSAENRHNIIPKDKIVDFIEKVSDINLEEYSKKILKEKINIFPY